LVEALTDISRVNDYEERSKRYRKFDIGELIAAAARSAGGMPKQCTGPSIHPCNLPDSLTRQGTQIMKFPEGQYNKAFLLTFDDKSEVVAKLPNPNAGPPILTTASEVATMEFVSH
jgi:hypothetical protein